jgi:hypothetical protein
LNAAAVCQIEKWKLSRVENVACYDDVGAPEVNNTVAVGACTGNIEHLDAVAVVERTPPSSHVGIDRPRSRWCRGIPKGPVHGLASMRGEIVCSDGRHPWDGWPLLIVFAVLSCATFSEDITRSIR